ncbi:MAG: sodium-dependent transporter [Clostridia bacterium]|nr:sodium-dependent transporter [Clostridia bacterium]
MEKFDFSHRDGFTSKAGVIAAAAGSAIGLGNIWRFPYVAGENGGGAFLIVYIAFIFLIGMPVMLSELIIGRRAQRNPFGAFKLLKPGQPWYLIGLMGIGAAFMILAFYSTIAGWTLEYLYQSIIDGFSGKSAGELQAGFDSFQKGSWMPVIWQVIFMFFTAAIVWMGVKDGIEKYAKILMPVLLLIIIIISVRSVTLPGAMAGIEFLFKPDFSKINAQVILEALGQAFFSLSIGMGTLITYGSYIYKKDNLTSTAFAVSGADTLIAVLAGVAIFPAVFAFGIDPAAGEGLVFITLPNIFQQMAGGYFWALLFFILLAVAALTSTISVLEVVVAYFSEELNIPRKRATAIAAGLITVLGIFCTLSLGPYDNLKLWGGSLFGDLEYLSANVLLPLGGLLIVTFVAWFMGRKVVRAELCNEGTLSTRFFGVFMFIIRFLAPVAIALVFMNGVGLLNF